MNIDEYDCLTPDQEAELDRFFEQDLEVDFTIVLDKFLKTLRRVLS